MANKRRYQALPVNSSKVTEQIGLLTGRVIIGMDIAKTKQFAAFAGADGTVRLTVRWNHPKESPEVVALLEGLQAKGEPVEIVMEPSSTYGDALRVAMLNAGLGVYRINPKRSHDAAEVFDGVPSLHDAKSAAILAKLHLDGLSEPWPQSDDNQRALAAGLRVLAVYEEQFRKNRNRLEALLARHWPELPRELELGSATLLEVLKEFGSARELARYPAEARALMTRVGGRFLDPSRIHRVVKEAATSFGVDPTEAERESLREIAREASRCRRAASQAKRRVEALTEEDGAAHLMRPVVGKTSAAVLVAALGDPRNYHCAAAYRKALGLNLREQSSGELKGALHLTKRGPGLARLYLYMAALRLIKTNSIIAAWYVKKVKRQGGQARNKAVIAIMRKLAVALWHVAQGAAFDARKLFDVSRLRLPDEALS